MSRTKITCWKIIITLQIACAVCAICKPLSLCCSPSNLNVFLKPKKHNNSLTLLGEKSKVAQKQLLFENGFVRGSTGSRVQRLPGGSRELQRNRSEPQLSGPERTHVLLREDQRTEPPPAPAGQLGATGQCCWVNTGGTRPHLCVKVHVCACVGGRDGGRRKMDEHISHARVSACSVFECGVE